MSKNGTAKIVIVSVAVLWNLFSLNAFSEEVDPAVKAAAKTARSEIEILAAATGKAGDPLIEQSLELLDSLIAGARNDQDWVLLHARAINANINSISDGKFKQDIKRITSKLVKSSYSDFLHQNDNLSNQIATRLPNLVAESSKISQGQGDRESFREELQIIAERYLGRKTFRLGIGASYSYIPSIRYASVSQADFSQIILAPEPEPLPPGDNTPPAYPGAAAFNYGFINRFENQSYASFFVAARMPYLHIRLSLPKYEETSSRTSSVMNIGFRNQPVTALAVTEVSSTLKVDYDVSLSVNLDDVIARISGDVPTSQFVLGLGGGILGYEITDRSRTDLRMIGDEPKPFMELPNGHIIESENNRSMLVYYLGAFYDFYVSDELAVGFTIKKYFSEVEDELEVKVDGVTFAFTATWYPTYSFLHK